MLYEIELGSPLMKTFWSVKRIKSVGFEYYN
jgi:hypothetical protein